MNASIQAIPDPAAAPQRGASCITVAGVNKVYKSGRGDFTALSDINLDIADGEFISILGPSGCGKSTLLKCIAGLHPVSAGTITVRGKTVTMPPDGSGMVFQRDVLLDWRTVLDNVLLPVEFAKLNKADYLERAMELLKIFDLGSFAQRFPWELSGGMRQRAAICRGLLMRPSLLFMDEPFGALDAITRDELNLEMERVWERDRMTVLFVTHSIAEAVFLSDRVVVMSRNPGQVAEIIKIDLPRPRTLEMRETPQFAAYVGHLRSVFETLGIMRRGAV